MKYEEAQVSPWIVLLLAVIAWLGVMLVLQVGLGRQVGANPSPNWLLIALTVFLILIAANFASLKITIDDKSFTARYGVLARRITLSQILSCRPTTYSWLTYGGWGIRRGSDGSVAYTTWGKRGIELKTAEQRYVISTTNADKICSLLKAKGIAEIV